MKENFCGRKLLHVDDRREAASFIFWYWWKGFSVALPCLYFANSCTERTQTLVLLK